MKAMSVNKTIGSQGFGVQITTLNMDVNSLWVDIQKNPLLQRFIPNLTFSNEPSTELRVINSKFKDAVIDKMSGLLQGEYGEDFNSTDVIVMAEYLLERLRQGRKIYTIHSSSIFKDDKGILLLANLTGSGKTSTALNLVNNFGYGLFSDEKTHIDQQINLVGQTSKIILEEKTTLSLNSVTRSHEQEIEIKKAGKKKLALIVLPVVTNSSTQLEFIKYSHDQTRWLIYEELSKDIRLVNGLVHKFTYPLMSQDTVEMARNRAELSEYIAKNIPVYLVKGRLDQISDKVNQLFEAQI